MIIRCSLGMVLKNHGDGDFDTFSLYHGDGDFDRFSLTDSSSSSSV